jgi:HEAT repeat protein
LAEKEIPLEAVISVLPSRGGEDLIRKLFEEEVRFAVVYGLLTLEDEKSIQALIELSEDEDEDVR